MQYRLQAMQELRVFIQLSENREALTELVFALGLSTIYTNRWQQSFVAKARAFIRIAKAVLNERAGLDG